jgi:hypothetical protein
LDPSDSYFLLAEECRLSFYTHWTYMHISRHIFLSNYWWQRSDIWSQASYWYLILWKRFWTHQIPTSCLPTFLIFMHIEHTFCICPFLVTFFSATIDGRNLIFCHKLHIGTPYRGKRFLTRQILTSCLPKSGVIISELMLTVHLVINTCTKYVFKLLTFFNFVIYLLILQNKMFSSLPKCYFLI